MESSTLPDESVVSATADIVGIASHVDNNHKAVDVVEKGVKVKRCSIYPNLACEDHVRTSEVGKKYIKGRFAAPVSIWCDPAGKELFRRHGYRKPDVFLADLKEALGKVTGTRIAKSDYDRQAVPLEEAQAASAGGKYKAAIEGFTAAAKGGIEALRKDAETGLADVVRTGRSLLTRSRSALDAGRKDQALEALKMLAAEFGSLDCGREAAELLKTIGVEDKDRK
jgi:hypothetical protein